MHALRLIRGAGVQALTLRLSLGVAAAGVGLLLLATLDLALQEPQRSDVARLALLWSLAPLTTVVWLTVTLARSVFAPAGAARGTARHGALAVLSATLPILLGSVCALALFWSRQDTPTARAIGAESLLTSGQPLSPPAALALSLLTPLVAACACALALRPGRARWSRTGRPAHPATDNRRRHSHWRQSPAGHTAVAARPALLGWAAASIGTGLAALSVANGSWAQGRPATPMGWGPAVWSGGVLVALGLLLSGPVLTALVGRALTTADPGPARLLAGRLLTAHAVRSGYALGVLTVGAWAAVTVTEVYGPGGLVRYPALGGTVLLLCAVGAVGLGVTCADRGRCPECGSGGARECAHAGGTATRDVLHLVGAPGALFGRVTALRCGALALAYAPVVGLLAWLTAFPLSN